ncbi:MAG TPA: M57 family metalloprotease [Kofleriaceae bacterium]|nr:M57 family metalloprotease [Kofleriaceae bacterium]
MALAMWSVLVFGCGVEPEGETLPSAEVQEILENLEQAGFPADDIMIVDGTVYVGRDAEVSLAASREMLEAGDSKNEQYRTTNLVSSSVTKICVNGSTFTGIFSTALDLAIQNYEEQPLRFAMARTPSNGCSFTINAVIAPGVVGGSAGFPSGGLPYSTINIGDGLAPYGVEVIEHVITHELGHTIGFRHSDYYNRSISCGSGGNEGSAGVGAILIPGTPSTATVGNSLMNSCFRSVETGEFTSSDVTALITLYRQQLLQLQRWATQQGGFWDTQQWLIGDFNGDGKLDLANVFNDGGLASIDVHLSYGNSFGIQRWATRQGGFWDTQKWAAGDFNGDGKADLANVFNDGGLASIDVHLSYGSSFGIARWATRQGGFWDAQKWAAGDFNGDGKADLANVFNDGGLASLDVHLSYGSSFGIQRWATRQGGFWDAQKWAAGDFNGDGRADLANVFNDGGLASIDVHLSYGSSFGIERWATKQGGFWDAQKWAAGDVTGDYKADLVNVFNDGGLASLDVHRP